MHCHQIDTAARPTSLNDNACRAAAYGRSAVGHGFDLSAPHFSDEGVGAQWTACHVAAQSDGYHIAESPDFLFGDDAVSLTRPAASVRQLEGWPVRRQLLKSTIAVSSRPPC